MVIQPSLYSSIPLASSTKTLTTDNSKSQNIQIHSCPFSNRVSLQDLTVYSVKMPWKLLAREFEIFDPSAMKEHTAYPRTPTSLPPSSPRVPFPSSSSSSHAAVASSSGDTTSNLNGPMGVWVATASTAGAVNSEATPSTGLRITAPPISSSTTHVRRRRKRNSDGVLMELDSHVPGSVTESSPRPSVTKTTGHMVTETTGPREFRRIAFSDVLAPSFRPVENTVSTSDVDQEEEEEEEDISDEAILKRHEATLTSMRDRYQAIQELKSSLKKSATGDDEAGHGANGSANGHSGAHSMSNISHAHNKRRKGGPRPPTPKQGGRGVRQNNTASSVPGVFPRSASASASALSSSSSPKTPKRAALTEEASSSSSSRNKVSTRHSKSPRSPATREESVPVPVSAPQQRKRGRPMKLNDA